MPTPCYLDPAFHGTATAMNRAKKKCADCPARQVCFELGLGQRDGVYGGTVPTDPIRVQFRRSVDRGTCCPNGHPKDEYGVEIDGPGLQPVDGCTYCAGLQVRLTELSS